VLRSTLEPDGGEARGDQQLGDGASLTEPSEKVPGARPPSGAGVWLLELGAAKREAAQRSQLHEEQGHRLRAWGSRRARRLVVRHSLGRTAAAGPPAAPIAPVEPVSIEAEAIEADAIEAAAIEPELPVAGQRDFSREDTVEVPAVEVHMVALPPVEPELVAEPSVVRLPPLPAEIGEPQLAGAEPGEPAEERVLVGVAASNDDDETVVEGPASVLLERISAYTLSPRARHD
jgi:hypothetical protein